LRAASALLVEALAPPWRLPPAVLRCSIARRCLVGVDIDREAVRLARSAPGDDLHGAALIESDFLRDGSVGESLEGPFDIVLGTPPWGGWNRMLDPETKRGLRDRFVTARGLIDPFALFLERAIDRTSPGGRIAMVLPDYFLLKNYPAVRRHLLE